MNGQITEIKGNNVLIAYHPEQGEPVPGQALLIEERNKNNGRTLVVQVIAYDSITYPGDRESLLGEILEDAIGERHDIVKNEPAMLDLKEIKILRCKIRKVATGPAWNDWDGPIPSRNVTITPITADELLARILPGSSMFPMPLALYQGQVVEFDASLLDKVNVLVGVKGSGKSHTAKLVVHFISALGAPCWIFDLNKEFVDLPGADAIRVGDNYRLCLAEVGFPVLMALIDEMNPLTEISRGALEHAGPRFVAEEVSRNGFATIGYLLDRAGRGNFHNNDMVNQAIEQRLRMVQKTGVFADAVSAETLGQRFDRVTKSGGFLVFDLGEMPRGRLKALTRGLNRRLEAICLEERKSGRNWFPFVVYEEAHLYAPPEEIVNLITRGRHLGLTTVFVTNTPSELPEVVFRQIDNLIVTGLSHSSDLRIVSKCSLTDEDTLQSLAMSLGRTQALFVGRITGGYPLVADVAQLPPSYPTTGQTRSFWDTKRNPFKKSA